MASPAAAASGPLKKIRVGTLPTIGTAPFLIAQQRGYFAQEGLEVELVNFASGGEIVAPLGAGQIDAAVSIAPSAGLVNAVARNVTLKVVADNGSIKPNRNIGNIVVRTSLAPASGYLDLATVPTPIRAAATGEGLLPHAILLLEAEKAGLKLSDVSMAFMGLPDVNAALQSGALDIAASGEPLITIGEQQGLLARWKPMADLYPDMPYSNMLYGPNLLEKDREAGAQLMRGYLRGVRDYEAAFTRNRDRDAILGILAEPLRTPPALFQALQDKGGLAYFNPNGAVNPEPLRPIVDLWTRTGLIQPGFDPAKLVDNSFADAATARLGPYQ